ncbi:MAG: zinc-dependent metalloprotease [Bacteroidales bacterium]|nr:zinc-dependent metalloprotease [Bacteroidales bacterium]
MKLKKTKALILTIIFMFVLGISAFPQKKDKEKKAEPKFKKYEEIIPDSAITQKGVFTIHEVNNKLYYEIDKLQLGKEFLWVTQFSKTQTSFGYGGVEVIRRVVRWEKFKDHILLRNVEYMLRADKNTPEEVAVNASSIDQIIKSFKIKTFGKNNAPVIEVTDLFKGDVHEFSAKEDLKASGRDKTRSFISSAKAFKKNIETKVLATYNLKPPKRENRYRHSDPSLGAVTVELHHSMIELPEIKMRPRIFDHRVGYFTGTHQDFSSNRHQVEPIKYIRRWRLEKKDPNAEVSEPVKPIIYYVGRGVPKKWQKYVIEAVNMWQPVFEAAGFKNAIMGKMAPSLEENPDFDAEDIRYSTIRWLPSTIANAYGPHVQDPRTGEILEADIRVFHNVISLIRDWYFIQASPSDPSAQKLPLSDETIGAALRYVVAHEVGHTLGLRHNFKATASYEVEKYRDLDFTTKYGLEASIMDYGRFNYIAQPGDNVRRIPIIGPYDYFAIEWGYKQFKNSNSIKEDTPFLTEIVNRQLTDPMLRFSGGRENGVVGFGDPHARSEDLGNDPIKATSYGLKNIEYITTYLVKACGEKDKDYTMLKHMYKALVAQMYRELSHVGALVGGIEVNNYVYGQSSNLYVPTSAEEQKQAINFLIENGFKTPDYLLKEDIISRIGMHGIEKTISQQQVRLLKSVLNPLTANRMIDLEASHMNNYLLVDMIKDLHDGLFYKTRRASTKTDIYKRNLQRAFVEQLISFADGKKATRNDLQAISKGILTKLRKDLHSAISNGAKGIEYYHYTDLKSMIEKAIKG